MVTRPPWRLLESRYGDALPAADHGSGLRLRGGQCRGAEPLALVAAQLDQAPDRGAPVAPRIWAWRPTVPLPSEPQGHRLSARVARRNDPVRRQPVALGPGGRARSRRIPRPAGHRGAGAQRVPAGRRAALPADPAAAQLLLVRDATAGK